MDLSIKNLKKIISTGTQEEVKEVFKVIISKRDKYLVLIFPLLEISNEKLEENPDDLFWTLMKGASQYFIIEERNNCLDAFKKIIAANKDYLLEAYNFASACYSILSKSSDGLDIDKGIKYAQKALELNSLSGEYPFLDESEFVMAYSAQLNYFGDSSKDKSVYYYNRIINNSNDKVFLYFSYSNLGVFWGDEGNIKKAIECFRKALTYDDSPLAKANLASYDYTDGNLEETFKLWDEVLSNFDNSLLDKPKEQIDDIDIVSLKAYAVIYFNKAVYEYDGLHKEKDYDKAVKCLEEGMKTKLSYAYFKASSFYLSLEKEKENYDVLSRGFEHAIDFDANLINDYGICVYEGIEGVVERDVDRAITIFERAAKYNNKIALYNLGLCYYEKEEDLEALKYFQKSYEQGYAGAKEFIDDLSERLSQKTKMSEYIKSLYDLNLNGADLYNQIRKDLIEDFGESYFKIPDHIIDSFALGIYSFAVYACLPDSDKLDYSSATVSIAKGLESFLYDIVIFPYINYLIKNKVPIETVNPALVTIDKNGNKRIGLEKFSIGAYKHYVGIQEKNKPYVIDAYYIDFVKSISKPGSNSAVKFIFDFVNDITKIRDIRNHASHRNPISRLKAEEVIDFVIKDRKLIKRYIDRII